MPDAEIARIHTRLDRLEDTARVRGDTLGEVQADVREIRALLQGYATTQAVYDSLAPIQEGMHELQQSGSLLAREVTTIAHNFEELTAQVRKVIAMHEQSLQDKAREDQAKANREREAAERREQEAQAKHALEMKSAREESEAKIKAIQDEAKNKKFINRLRQNWLPFLGALLAVIIAFATLGEKMRAFFSWLFQGRQ